jgi:hypothetical protein
MTLIIYFTGTQVEMSISREKVNRRVKKKN